MKRDPVAELLMDARRRMTWAFIKSANRQQLLALLAEVKKRLDTKPVGKNGETG